MARTEVTVTQIERDSPFPGVTPIAQVAGDTVNGHYFAGNTGQEFLEIENLGGSATVTVLSPLEVDGLPVNNLSIGAPSGTVLVGPFRKNTFNQNSSGDVYFNVSSENLRLRAYKLVRTA